MSDKTVLQPVQLVPVIASLTVAILYAFAVLNASVVLYDVTPFPENVPGSLGNGFYFVILAGLGASIMYLLLKRKSHKLITFIVGFALTTTTFLVTLVLFSALFSFVEISYGLVLVLLFSVVATVLIDFAVFRTTGARNKSALLFISGALGAFLGISIPVFSAILILSFLAVYDVYAVFRGAVGKIANAGMESLRGLSLSFKSVEMGLGDLVFYSMLVALVLANAGPAYCLASVLGVLAGVLLGFKMLQKRGVFPGLPFPVAFGLLPLIVWLLL